MVPCVGVHPHQSPSLPSTFRVSTNGRPPAPQPPIHIVSDSVVLHLTDVLSCSRVLSHSPAYILHMPSAPNWSLGLYLRVSNSFEVSSEFGGFSPNWHALTLSYHRAPTSAEHVPEKKAGLDYRRPHYLAKPFQKFTRHNIIISDIKHSTTTCNT